MPNGPWHHRDRRVVSPRPTRGITATDAWYHRKQRLVSPRMTPAITGVHGSRHRTTLQVRDTEQSLSRNDWRSGF